MPHALMSIMFSVSLLFAPVVSTGMACAADYPTRTLTIWARRIASSPSRETLVYFNNDAGGAAVRDARRFTDLLRRA